MNSHLQIWVLTVAGRLCIHLHKLHTDSKFKGKTKKHSQQAKKHDTMEDDNSQEMEELAHVTLPIHTLSGEYGYVTSEDDEEGVKPLFPTEIVNMNDQQSTTHTPGWVDVMQCQAVTRNAQLEMQLQQDVLQ